MPGFARQQRIIGVMILFSLLLSVMISTTFAQEDNVCRDASAVYIEDGDTLTGTLNPNIPFTFFCYEGERGTDITITIEHVSANLNTVFFVTTPFIDSDGLLVDEILFAAESLGDSEYEGTVSIEEDDTYLIAIQGEQNVQGTFLITLEEATLVLGGDPDDDDDDNSDTENDSSDDDDDGTLVLGETNLCNTPLSVDIEEGETEEGTTDIQPIFYCIEASANDIITIEFTLDGDVPMGFLVFEPTTDLSQDAIVYAQGLAQTDEETVSAEFLVPADGQYLIYVAAAVEDTGSFSMTVTSDTGNVYTCQNEPLNTLVRSSWGVRDADGNTIMEINIACGQLMIVSVMGIPQIAPYSITQDGEFFFQFQDFIYVTDSIGETEWTIVFPELGQEYVLEPVSEEDTCDDEELFQVVQGSWLWEEQNQAIIFDFTCDGIVIIDNGQDDPFPAAYEFDGTEIIIYVGQSVLVFSDINLTAERLTATTSGFVVELTNLLYDPDAVDADVEAEVTEEAEATEEADSD